MAEADHPSYDEAGVAKIKKEYILHDHKPVLDTEYISKEDQNQLEDKQPSADGENDGPPSKKMKLKGRNKQRPKGRKIDHSERLCPAVKTERVCDFGNRCKFCHDKKKFFENKPPDLGPECYLYETYGTCPSGITCRYAKAHVSEDLNNLSKDDVAEKPKREETICNVLTKDLQKLLWKRRYDFSKADKVIANVCTLGNVQKKYDRKKPVSQDGSNKNEGSLTGNANSATESKSTGNSTDGTVDHNGSKTTEPTTSLTAEPVGQQTALSVQGQVSIGQDSRPDPTASVSGTNTGVVEEGVDNSVKAASKQQLVFRPQEKKKVDFSDKLYLAPLTTVGNLPFRRICKRLGADITCGEMAVCTNLLQGQQSEWALLKRHESEDIFGVQLCGGYPDAMTRCAQLITETMNVDFIDINCGCPIDLIFNKGEGSALMGRVSKLEQIVKGMTSVMDVPLTVKVRTGVFSDKNVAHTLMPKLRDWDVALATVHGRSRVQRYTKTADWDYIDECARAGAPMPVFGNGDILSFEEANQRREETGVSGLMIARGALIKPWVFTEIKEQRHWDISSSERLQFLRDYTNYGLDHWGSDHQGVENTRRFLLEWLSFLHRYIPVGLLERLPQRVNEKPPYYRGRDDLETLMASPNCGDWIKISEMLLGPVPDEFSFLPKHKANAYK